MRATLNDAHRSTLSGKIVQQFNTSFKLFPAAQTVETVCIFERSNYNSLLKRRSLWFKLSRITNYLPNCFPVTDLSRDIRWNEFQNIAESCSNYNSLLQAELFDRDQTNCTRALRQTIFHFGSNYQNYLPNCTPVTDPSRDIRWNDFHFGFKW